MKTYIEKRLTLNVSRLTPKETICRVQMVFEGKRGPLWGPGAGGSGDILLSEKVWNRPYAVPLRRWGGVSAWGGPAVGRRPALTVIIR